MRIVSLCPSQTETLFALGSQIEIVGRTDYCIHPKTRIDSVPRVGGTKNFSIQQILKLKPDLVIAEKEENPKDRTLELARLVPVKVTDVRSISQALAMIQHLGEWTGTSDASTQMIADIRKILEPKTQSASRPNRTFERVLYLIWKDPWMIAGPDTYIHSVVEWLGFQNAALDLPTDLLARQRYPKVTLEDMRNLKPDRIFLSTEPYAFQPGDIPMLETIPAQIQKIDGELASWYGVRMKRLGELRQALV